MRVSIRELRETCDVLLSHLERSGVEEVDLDVDPYWHVPTEQRYDPYREPHELTLGQLSDDCRELDAMRVGAKEPIRYGLVWLASVLRAVGDPPAA